MSRCKMFCSPVPCDMSSSPSCTFVNPHQSIISNSKQGLLAQNEFFCRAAKPWRAEDNTPAHTPVKVSKSKSKTQTKAAKPSATQKSKEPENTWAPKPKANTGAKTTTKAPTTRTTRKAPGNKSLGPKIPDNDGANKTRMTVTGRDYCTKIFGCYWENNLAIGPRRHLEGWLAEIEVSRRK